jgi:hypothetical protein
MSTSSALLRGSVDASLQDVKWMKIAKWLKASPTLKCFPSTMVYGAKTCASKALAIYVGKAVPTLPGGGRSLSIDTVCETAHKHGLPMKLLYDIGANGSTADRCLLFGTVPNVEGGCSGDKGCLIAVRNAGTTKLADVRPKMETILDSGVERMTLIVFNDALYEFGHCIVIRRLKDKFYLSDPLLPAGTCLCIPSRDHMVLLMCSATTILGA